MKQLRIVCVFKRLLLNRYYKWIRLVYLTGISVKFNNLRTIQSITFNSAFSILSEKNFKVLFLMPIILSIYRTLILFAVIHSITTRIRLFQYEDISKKIIHNKVPIPICIFSKKWQFKNVGNLLLWGARIV